MTRVDSSAWVEKARVRKAYRDHVRDKFFRDVKLPKGAGVADISKAPADQIGTIKALISLTRKSSVLEQDQLDMLGLLDKALSSSGLAQGGQMANSSTNQANMSDMDMTSLYKNWFRSPSFFD